MCYLIAKDRESHGCLAFKTTHGKHLVELKRKLNRAVGYKGVHLVTIFKIQSRRALQPAGIFAL